MPITGAELHIEAIVIKSLFDVGHASKQETIRSVECILSRFHLAHDPQSRDYNAIVAIYQSLHGEGEDISGQWRSEQKKRWHSFSEMKPPTGDSEEGKAALEQLAINASIAAFPYTGRLELGGKEVGNDNLNPALTSTDFHTGTRGLTEEVSECLRSSVNTKFGASGAIKNDGDPKLGQIIDKSSGLTANLVVDHDKRRVNVVFGGTTSGLKKAGDFHARSKGNWLSTLSQWVSNVKTALGITPHSVKQAANLTQTVVNTVASSEALKGYEVVTIGHSKGAAEATYSALSLREPIRAYNFSAADLQGGLVRNLPKVNVDQAKSLVTNAHIKGDLVPNVRYVSPALRPLGTEFVLPRAEENAGLLGRHDQFAYHVSEYVKGQQSSAA